MTQNKTNPSVSVILPSYNRGKTLTRAIKSVLNQTFTDFELIIIDDASSDNTEKIVSEFNSLKIQYIKLDFNRGSSGARNYGIKNAKGKYIAFIDSDDCWKKEKLERQISILDGANDCVGLVFTAFWVIKNNRKKLIRYKQKFISPKNTSKLLLSSNFITIHALIKKECFECAGFFDERLLRLGDWDLWLRIAVDYDFICLNEPLVEIFDSQDAISKNVRDYVFALEILVKKHFKRFAAQQEILAKHYYCLGRMYADFDNKEKAKGYLNKALVCAPLNCKYFFFSKFSGSYSNLYKAYNRLKFKFKKIRN